MLKTRKMITAVTLSAAMVLSAVPAFAAEGEYNTAAQIVITPGEDGLTMLSDSIGLDLSWLSSLTLSSEQTVSGTDVNVASELIVNGETVLNADLTSSLTGGYTVLSVPQLLDQTVAFEHHMDQDQLSALQNIDVEELTELFSSLDYETMAEDLAAVFSDVMSSAQMGDTEAVEATVGSVTQTVYQTPLTWSGEALAGAADEVLELIRDSEDVQKVLESAAVEELLDAIADATDSEYIDLDGIAEQYEDVLDEYIESGKIDEALEGYEFDVTVYMDAEGGYVGASTGYVDPSGGAHDLTQTLALKDGTAFACSDIRSVTVNGTDTLTEVVVDGDEAGDGTKYGTVSLYLDDDLFTAFAFSNLAVDQENKSVGVDLLFELPVGDDTFSAAVRVDADTTGAYIDSDFYLNDTSYLGNIGLNVNLANSESVDPVDMTDAVMISSSDELLSMLSSDELVSNLVDAGVPETYAPLVSLLIPSSSVDETENEAA